MPLKTKVPWGASVYWGIKISIVCFISSIINLLCSMYNQVPSKSLLGLSAYFISTIILGFIMGFSISFYEIGIKRNYSVLDVFPGEE